MIAVFFGPKIFGSRYIFLCGFVVLFSGCGSSEPLEETIEQNYPIDSSGSVSIRNIDGSIQIYGGRQPGVHLEAIKKAYSPARLRIITVNVDARPNSIVIDTMIPQSKSWGFSDRSGTVDCILVVPVTCSVSRAELKNGEILVSGLDSGNVNASLENGRIFVRNCFGNVQATSATGAVSLIYDWWNSRKFSATARILDGNLFAIMPGDASFRLHAEAPNGKIGNDFAEQEERSEGPVTKVESVVGDSPEATMNLAADDGNIKIVEANP